MKVENNRLLSDYLERFLHDPTVEKLDVAKLDEPFRALGEELVELHNELEEFRRYSAALASGDLSVPVPSDDNPLCENLKALHASLNDLAKRTKAVAFGASGEDFTSDTCGGTLDEAISLMVERLREHESQSRKKLATKAYYDALTHIRNRAFFEEYMGSLLEQETAFTLCYMDMDFLKNVNDNFGHNEGDAYIRRFVETVKNAFRTTDVFARVGGDEFCLVLTGRLKRLAESKLANALRVFSDFDRYPSSFSYGVVEIDGEAGSYRLEDIIKEADREMYECKRRNKKRMGSV